MPTKRSSHPRLPLLAASLRTALLASVCVAAAACGNVDDLDIPAGATRSSLLTTGGTPIYDNASLYGTFQSYMGINIHVCPDGYAMQGTYGDSWLKCRQITTNGPRRLDLTAQSTLTPAAGKPGHNTAYTTMHSCLPGEVMVGHNISRNWLICQPRLANPFPYTTANYRDDATQDTEYVNVMYNRPPRMHTCGTTDDLMMGIHVGNNQLGCMAEYFFANPHP
jgi:hypothetical protein